MQIIYEKTMAPEAISYHMLNGNVIVLTDTLKNWDISFITFEKLKRNYGMHKLRIRGGTRFNLRPLFWINLSDYVDFICKKNSLLESFRLIAPYAAFNIIPEFKKSTHFENLVSKSSFHTPITMWLGPKNSLTPLHYDDPGNTIFAQIIGEKKFTLYPYKQKKYLYPSKVFDFTTIYSNVNIDDPDYYKFKEFKNSKKTELIIQAGEILIFPNKMWHQVETLEDSLSLSCRYIDKSYFFWAPYIKWYIKSFLHMVGFYKRKFCLCHVEPINENDMMMMPPIGRLLTKATCVKHHGKDLADMLDWNK